jgi:hypothetical protein
MPDPSSGTKSPEPLARPAAVNGEAFTVLLEVYRQAHETRRRWEGYIWQYAVVLTVLVAFFSQSSIFDAFAPTPGTIGTFSLVQKVVFTLVALFVVSIFANVYRARSLMKALENSIAELHHLLSVDVPVVPFELSAGLPRRQRISSTGIAVACHFLAAVAFVALAVGVWMH